MLHKYRQQQVALGVNGYIQTDLLDCRSSCDEVVDNQDKCWLWLHWLYTGNSFLHYKIAPLVTRDRLSQTLRQLHMHCCRRLCNTQLRCTSPCKSCQQLPQNCTASFTYERTRVAVCRLTRDQAKTLRATARGRHNLCLQAQYSFC